MILWADGFDDYSTVSGFAGEYENFANTVMSISGAAGRRSGGALTMVNFADYVQKTLGGAYSELFVSVAMKPGPLSQAFMPVAFYNGATAMVTLRVNTDGSISALRGDQFGTVLGTSAAALIASNVYTHLQVRVVFNGSAGIVQVRLNGATTPSLSLTAQNTGGTSATSVRLSSAISWSGSQIYFDDFVVSDTSGSVANTWLGDVRVDSYLPSGNGDLSQMTGSDGNSTDNYALVNAAAPSASTYTQGAVVGNEDLYQVADIDHNPTTIYGVVATAAALKDDAGTRAIRLHAKSGTTDARSAADITLGTTRQRVATVFETDPNTSAGWTKAGFNGAQFGFEVTV